MVAPLRVTDVLSESVTYVLGTFSAITHNVSHVGDVAPSLTEARGHVAERRAAAPRSPRHPLRVPMRLRAVMRSGAFANLARPTVVALPRRRGYQGSRRRLLSWSF
jgi:hypothetical protein